VIDTTGCKPKEWPSKYRAWPKEFKVLCSFDGGNPKMIYLNSRLPLGFSLGIQEEVISEAYASMDG
jgi:hypothetical protein